MARYFGKHGELRIQSAPVSASSNHYFVVAFENMNLSIPENHAFPDEIPVLDRGRLDANTRYVQGSDERVLAPVPVTFTADLDYTVNRQSLREALGNIETPSGVWTVNGLSFATTAGLSKLMNGSGVLISTPPPIHPNHLRVDLVSLWTGDNPSTNDIGRACREVWFPPEQITLVESDIAVQINVNGLCYGPVSQITAFSAGSAVNS